MATKIKNAIMYLFRVVGVLVVMFGGSALDSENIMLPIKICIIGMFILLVSVLMENSKHR